MYVPFASRNPTKLAEVRAIFADTPISILSMDDAKIVGEGVEDGTILVQNAVKKATCVQKFIYNRDGINSYVLADDTGLFIDVLDGRPGVHSARWAGEGATTEETTQYTLAQLEHVADMRRTAVFRTVAVLLTPLGGPIAFQGEVRGTILREPRVPSQEKMPYSAIFVPAGHSKTWAEMTTTEENAISHRGKAFRQARDYLVKKTAPAR